MSFDLVDMIVFGLMGVAILLTLIRLWIGPQAPDRIVAADTISVIATALIILLALTFGSALFLDVALIYAVLAFVGIIALARAIEGDNT